jgi:CRISPR-associated protein Csd1
MLEHLIAYGEQAGLEPEPGFAVKRVKWAISCAPGGKFLGVVPLGDTSSGKKNPGMEFTKAPDLTTYQMTGGQIKYCRHFLADTLSVVTLFDIVKPSTQDKGKHAFFKDLLRQASQNAPELAGLAEMLDSGDTLEKINQALKGAGAKPTDSVTFEIDGRFPLNSAGWHEWWSGWWRKNRPLTEGPDLMVDFLSGSLVHPMLSHYKISGLAGVGGQPTGDSLASFDKDAFRSYGLESSANAAFSKESVIAYVEPLNQLIRENSRQLPGVKVVYWYKDRLEDPNEEDLFCTIFDDDPATTLQALDRARNLLNAIRDGNRPALEGNRYFSMILSGAAGRVMLRDWMEGSFPDLVASIEAWFNQLSMVGWDGETLAPEPKLFRVLKATATDKEKILAPQSAQMYRCALDQRQPFPRWALAKTVIRARNDVLRGEPPRDNRMGLIKACLLRNPNTKGGEQLTPSLNEYHPSPAYQCGRLMAVYAALQRSALGDVGAGVVQRFYAAASVTPNLILGRLARLSQFHLNKLEAGLTYWYESLLASIWERIDSELPATLDLEDQGLFALGYYQQLAEIRRPKKNKQDQTAESGDKE